MATNTARRPETAGQHQSRETGVLTLRAATLQPATWNAEARTVEVIWSTGADVERSDWMTGDRYVERLSMDPKAIRLDRLNGGASVLDAHSSMALRDVIGAVVPGTARIENGLGLATLRLSENPDQAGIVADIIGGVIRHISVGYVTHSEQRNRAPDGIEIRTATDWEPHELSFVPVPADAGAHSRAMPRTGDHSMAGKKRAVDAAQAQKVADDAAALAASAAEVAASAVEEGDDPPAEEMPAGEQSAAPVAPAAEPERAAPVAPVVEDATDRALGIHTTLRALGISADRAPELIASKRSLAEVRDMLINERADAAAATRVNSAVTVLTDHTEQVREGVTNALLHRADPRRHPLTDAGRAHARMRLIDVARASLTRSNIDHSGMSDSRVFGMALRTHSTADFPLLLADVTQKSLLSAYAEAPTFYEPFCARGTVSNLQTRYPTILSGISTLATVAEGQPYPLHTLAESRESYTVAKRGGIVAITLEMLLKDDLSGFARIPAAEALAARRAENEAVADLLYANAVMSDGEALFSSAHKNISGSAGAPTAATLSATELKLALQTGKKSEPLDLMGYCLVAPRTLKVGTEQLFSPNYLPNAATSAITQDMQDLQRVYSAHLDANSTSIWYLFANPAIAPVIEYAFLEGEEGITLEEEDGFDDDTKKFKVRHWFGCGVVDFRGAVANGV